MFFFQHPSLPRVSATNEAANMDACALERVFGIEDISSDTQMREILSGAPTRRLREVLPEVFERARQLRMERCGS
jgi:hypothetical protein